MFSDKRYLMNNVWLPRKTNKKGQLRNKTFDNVITLFYNCYTYLWWWKKEGQL